VAILERLRFYAGKKSTLSGVIALSSPIQLDFDFAFALVFVIFSASLFFIALIWRLFILFPGLRIYFLFFFLLLGNVGNYQHSAICVSLLSVVSLIPSPIPPTCMLDPSLNFRDNQYRLIVYGDSTDQCEECRRWSLPTR